MMFVCCAIVIMIRFLVNCDIPLSVPEQDKTDLDEYAKEVNRLFDDMPILNNTSEERVYKPNDSELFSKHSSAYDDGRPYPDNIKSSSERIMPEDTYGEVAQQPGSHQSPEVSRDIPSFSIDKGINSSATGNQSQHCALDRQHITSLFKECIYNQVRLATTTQTANMPEPSTRDYDARFLKYCRRAPQLRSCVKNLIVNKMEHCLDEGLRDSIDNVEQITERIIKFICIKESDRISVFISDGGLECLISSNLRMHTCLSLYLGSHVLISLFELPSLNLEKMKCVNLLSTQRCVAQELELCEDPTSAVVARLLFQIAMEVASCEDMPETSTTTTASDTLELFSVPSLSDGKQTTKEVTNLEPQISEGLEHEVTEYSTSSVTFHQGRTDQYSNQSSTLNASSAASGKGQL